MTEDAGVRESKKPGQAPEKAALGGDLIIPLSALAFTLYYFTTIWDLTWEAKINGFMVGSILIALVAVFVARTLRRVSRGEAHLGLGALWHPLALQRKRLAMLLLSIAFIVVIEWLGFTLTTFAFVACALGLLGVRSPRKLAGIPLAVAGGGYILFILLLDTRFPHGPFEQLMEWLFLGSV